MKTVKFFYKDTTQDLQVPDDTPVLTSNVDKLMSDRPGLEIVREAMEQPVDSPRLSELAKGKPELLAAINEALDAIKADGTYAEISQKYFGEDVSQ